MATSCPICLVQARQDASFHPAGAGFGFQDEYKAGGQGWHQGRFFCLFLNIEIHLFFWGKCPSDHCKPAFNYPALKKLIFGIFGNVLSASGNMTFAEVSAPAF